MMSKFFLIKFLISALRALINISFFEFIKAVNEIFKTLERACPLGLNVTLPLETIIMV